MNMAPTESVISSVSSGDRKSSPRLIDIISPKQPTSSGRTEYIPGNVPADVSHQPGEVFKPLFFTAVDPAVEEKPKRKKLVKKKKSSNRRAEKPAETVTLGALDGAPQSSQFIILTPDRERTEALQNSAPRSKKKSSTRRKPIEKEPEKEDKPKDFLPAAVPKDLSRNRNFPDHIDIASPVFNPSPKSNPRSNPKQPPPNSNPKSGDDSMPMSARKSVDPPRSSVKPKSSGTDSEQGEFYVNGRPVSASTVRKARSKSPRPGRDLISEVNRMNINDDGFNLDSAINEALKTSTQESIREAEENDEQIRARVLKSMQRPNDLRNAVETLVSKRREEIKAAKSSTKKPTAPTSTPGTKPTKVDVADEDPFIETVEEPDDKPAFVVHKKIPKKYRDEEEEGNNESETSEEENVKLPNAYRDRRDNEKLGPPDALGNRDRIYDPLGADRDLYEDYEFNGDGNPYEESSEDEDMMTIDEKKDEMIYRFKLVQESYPNIALPRITKKMKLARMVRHYDCVQDRLKLRIKTKNLRIFMVGGFLALQYGVKWLTGLDTSGFTQNQMKCIGIYTRFLREFGESDWSSIGENMPIWIRLPFAVGINFAIFMAAKYMFKATKKDHTAEFHRIYAEMTGDDSFNYLREKDTSVGLDEEDGEGGGGAGGIFGMIQKVMGMFGGGGGGENRPARGQAEGPSYVRRKDRQK